MLTVPFRISDIDECSDPEMNVCQHQDLCNNTLGSFDCKCPSGTKLQNDKRTCTGKRRGHSVLSVDTI